jgi:uncharacterized protein YbjT (DUF2867 family)
VLGATGTIGKAVVQLLKDKGHEVVVVSRSTQPSVDMVDPSSLAKCIGKWAAKLEMDASQ